MSSYHQLTPDMKERQQLQRQIGALQRKIHELAGEEGRKLGDVNPLLYDRFKRTPDTPEQSAQRREISESFRAQIMPLHEKVKALTAELEKQEKMELLQKMNKLKEDYMASAEQRRNDIFRIVTDPHQRMIALQKHDEELERFKKEGLAKREEELKGLFGGRGKKSRKGKSKKARKTRRRRA
jgi:hypothetical protein